MGGEAVLLGVRAGHVVLGAVVGVGAGRVLRVVFQVSGYRGKDLVGVLVFVGWVCVLCGVLSGVSFL